jgi:hypothetical protein
MLGEGSGRLTVRRCLELDRLDPQRSRLAGLVSIPRLDDRLGLFAGREGLLLAGRVCGRRGAAPRIFY